MTTLAESSLAMKLKDSSLFRQQAYIGGRWRDSSSGKRVEVLNPANGELIGTAPACTTDDIRSAIQAAEQAWQDWRERPAKERAAILQNWFALMHDNLEDLALIMTVEQGKPLVESRGEIAYAASFIQWFAEEAKRVYGDIIPSPSSDRRLIVTKQPVGVVATITPWNFPSAMITRKAAPALAAGCTLVAKPSNETPYSAFALCVLAERAGIPPGVINMVTGDPKTIGLEFTTSATVRKVSFTGSTRVGKLLMQQSASTVKKISMELGGNAPFIVFDDADVPKAVAGAMQSKFRNSGQTCVCANRVLVQEKVYDRFVELFAREIKNLKVGDGTVEGTTQGPLISNSAVEKVEEQIQDAVSKGARLLLGGERPQNSGGSFLMPALVVDATQSMSVAAEETFGPLAPVFKFKTEEEAVRMANDTEFGLAAYLYTRDVGRSWRVSEQLEYGIVSVNAGIFSSEVAPFGGMKESGIGREGSKYGIDDYLEIKYICMAGI